MICLRYIMLAYVLCLRRISGALCEMFPTNESLIERGLATRWDFQLSKVKTILMMMMLMTILMTRAEVAMLEDEASRVIGSKSTLTATRFKIKTKLVQNQS